MIEELKTYLASLKTLLEKHLGLRLDKSWVGADELPEKFEGVKTEITEVNKNFDNFYNALMQELLQEEQLQLKKAQEKTKQPAEKQETSNDVLINAWSYSPVDICNLIFSYVDVKFFSIRKIQEKLLREPVSIKEPVQKKPNESIPAKPEKIIEILEEFDKIDNEITMVMVKMFCMKRYDNCSKARAERIYEIYEKKCQRGEQGYQGLLGFLRNIPSLVRESITGCTVGDQVFPALPPQNDDYLIDGDLHDLDFSINKFSNIYFYGANLSGAKFSDENIFSVIKNDLGKDELFCGSEDFTRCLWRLAPKLHSELLNILGKKELLKIIYKSHNVTQNLWSILDKLNPKSHSELLNSLGKDELLKIIYESDFIVKANYDYVSLNFLKISSNLNPGSHSKLLSILGKDEVSKFVSTDTISKLNPKLYKELLTFLKSDKFKRDVPSTPPAMNNSNNQLSQNPVTMFGGNNAGEMHNINNTTGCRCSCNCS